jgi:hypothetical protein
VLAAHIGRLRPNLLLSKIPMICSSVNRLGFMSIPFQVARGSAHEESSNYMLAAESAEKNGRCAIDETTCHELNKFYPLGEMGAQRHL